ncbi:cold-shock protein [Pedobacter rhizosphaerae]|uniref:Cold shock protein, CspA family n=1 Tax=Pedobacter rhizosphaerae TaxID=390241 RepID=A0A1H9KXT0_9SPHI|nr:cold shock domain-containing protein [Pedobacter rhizosphaerae]SER03677.1 Cold shock protein, CspA family [Pedobacter rhizosphaerae]
MNEYREGKVVELNPETGFGLIIDQNGQDIYFLLSEVSGLISVDSLVNFDIIKVDQGLMAINISLLL